ncbi:MAG: cobalamin-dependent protein [Thermodesulfobacteriota bacterium]
MKITIISPPFGEKGQKSDNLQMAPPVLEYLASLIFRINPEVEVELIDANREDLPRGGVSGDVVFFSTLTPQAPWTYGAADAMREAGKRVVIGGMHVTALPEEGKLHADAIVVGEAESVMAALLGDAAGGKLAPFYRGESLSLEGLPRRRRGLLKGSYRFDSFFTARGCPYRCTFCSVRRFFGDTIRYRPIGEVTSEVASSPQRMLMNIDDNIWGVDISRSIELFKAFSSEVRGKWWFGQADLITVQHRSGGEMLKWAERSGLTTVMVGWETNDPGSLESYKAGAKQGRDRVEAVRKIRESGIDVMLFVMVGGRAEGIDEYMRVLELCDRLDVSAHPVMLTPFPGTELYEEYGDYLMEGKSWDEFDGNTAVFRHDDPSMTPEKREQATLWLRKELFTWPRILRRIAKISPRGFPMAHVNSIMLQWAHRRAFNEYARDHLKGFDAQKILGGKAEEAA